MNNHTPEQEILRQRNSIEEMSSRSQPTSSRNYGHTNLKKKSKIDSSSKANKDKDSDSVSDTAAVIDSIPHLGSDKKLSPR